MLSRKFLIDLLERSVSTAAQAALLAIGADQLNAVEADWLTVLGFAAGGAILSVLKGLAAASVGDRSSAALIGPGPVPDAYALGLMSAVGLPEESADEPSPHPAPRYLGVDHRTNATLSLTSDTGLAVVLPASTGQLAGLMSGPDKAKLDSIESGASADQVASEVRVTGIPGATNVQEALDLLLGRTNYLQP